MYVCIYIKCWRWCLIYFYNFLDNINPWTVYFSASDLPETSSSNITFSTWILWLELLVTLGLWLFWFFREMWMMMRSIEMPASKVPPKPSRMPYNSGRSTSESPFWYSGTGARSTMRSRSRHVRSLTDTHMHTHTAQTGQTHLPSQRTMGAF